MSDPKTESESHTIWQVESLDGKFADDFESESEAEEWFRQFPDSTCRRRTVTVTTTTTDWRPVTFPPSQDGGS